MISRLLGRGGMGAVYVVEHRYTGKRLALKCLLPEHLEQPEFIERFLREAQAAGRIQHRNVVDVFDVGQDGELIYIVMELLEGKPLGELLRDDQLSLEEVLQIMLRAMEGVAAAHKEGIVHRDLKPDNIFVCVGQSGRLDDPRVLDFGISKLEDDVSKPLTRSGVMLGTPYYMAFEQINSQRDLDLRVDVYAMGVILYEAMSGQPPYAAESVGALAIRMMTAPPMPLGRLRPELPEGLTDVVMRAIARDREERFQSMQALVDALRPYANDPSHLLVPRGQGTPLRSSVRASYATDATLPAMSSITPTPSDRRLKLDLRDDHDSGGRLKPTQGSSKALLIAGGVALAAIVAVGALMIALRQRDDAITSTPTQEVVPAATPQPAPVPAQAAPPSQPPAQPAPVEQATAEPAPQPTPQPAPPSAEAVAPPSEPLRARVAARRRARERLIPSDELLMAPDSSMSPEGDVPPVEAPPTLPPDLAPTETEAPQTPEAPAPTSPEPTPQATPPSAPTTPPSEPTPTPEAAPAPAP
ncbi:MAG: serine/threonine-protein kinase [Polyangiales bacterium]